MSDPVEKPYINLSEINEHDAMLYRIGEYFETFANMEQLLAQVLGKLLKMEHPLIHFMWRDSFTDHKVKAVKRAAARRLGKKNLDFVALNGTLNEILNHAQSFRNDLAHGLIINDQGTTKHGRPGEDPDLHYEDFEPLTAEKIHTEKVRLSRIGMELVSFMSVPVVHK